jgi:hypothetical protein
MTDKNKYRIKGTNFGYDVPIIILIIIAFTIYIKNTQSEPDIKLSVDKISTPIKSSNSKSEIKEESPTQNKIETKDGTYLYSDNLLILTITVNGNRWFGKTVVNTGMGSDYDDRNTKYESGFLKNNSLFESTGMLEIGYISGNNLTTSIGGQTVVLKR